MDENMNIEDIFSSRTNVDGLIEKLENEWIKDDEQYLTNNSRELVNIRDYLQNACENGEKISDKENQCKEYAKKLDDVILQRKIVQQDVVHVQKKNDNFTESLEQLKTYRDQLVLELHQVQREKEERRQHLRARWDALKRALFIYKNHLSLFIEVNDHFCTVSFFAQDRSAKGKYFVRISYDNSPTEGPWKVDEIYPKLKPDHLTQLKSSVDFANIATMNHFRKLICELRTIFLTHYVEK